MPEEVAAQGDTAAAVEETTETTETTAEESTAESTEPTEQQASIDPAAFVLPEGFNMDQKALDEFLPIAKELNMTQAQAQKVVDMHAAALVGAVMAMESKQLAAQQAGEAEVKELFGADYEQNVGKIQHLLKEYGGDDAVNQPVYSNKAMMQTLLKIADAAGPGRFVMGKTGGDDLPTKTVLFAESLKKS